jgi:GNAT superfamily N-acetyltransferase
MEATSPGWHVRRAEPADAGAVVGLLQRLYDEIEHDVPASLARSTAATLLGDGDRFVALLAIDTQSGVPVGALTAIESAAIYAGGTIGVISEFYVAPESRSHGLGRELLAAIAHVGAERKWRRIEVTAPPDNNARQVAFYRRNGFETSGPHLKLPLANDRAVR